jgi:hypothetical protein
MTLTLPNSKKSRIRETSEQTTNRMLNESKRGRKEEKLRN